MLSDKMQVQRKRPFGITLLSLLFLWIGCGGSLIFPIVFFAGDMSSLLDTLTRNFIQSHALRLTGICLVYLIWHGLYILYAFIGFGLWKLRKWALQAIVIVLWVVIIGGLIAAVVVARYQAALAVTVGLGTVAPFGGILWYLSQPRVRYAFEVEADSLDIPVICESPSSSPSGRRWVKITIITVTCVTIFVGGVFYSVDKMFRTSEAYKLALSSAQHSPCIIKKLGTPISAKGTVSGNLSEGPTDGSADMEIPIHGTRGKGELDVSATKSAGTWTITSLSLIHDEGQIHLIPVSSSCQ